MILKTQVCEKFGIERPIFGFSHSVAVTAAVTNAGGLGVWGATHHEPHNIGPQIAQIRELVGDKPFGVDVLLPPSVGDETDRATVEARLPEEHKAFAASISKK